MDQVVARPAFQPVADAAPDQGVVAIGAVGRQGTAVADLDVIVARAAIDDPAAGPQGHPLQVRGPDAGPGPCRPVQPHDVA